MQAVSGDTVVSNLSWRYAVKKFDGAKKIPDAQWKQLEQALVLAPSSYGLQPWTFLVIKDPAKRAELRTVSWNQSQITDASHMVVFARKRKMTRADVDAYVRRTSQVRGVTVESQADYAKMLVAHVENPALDLDAWAAKQVYIALGVFLSSAAMMGIDACPMEGFDAAKYDQMLGLSAQGLGATVVATAGYRASDDWLGSLKKVRFDAGEVVKHI